MRKGLWFYIHCWLDVAELNFVDMTSVVTTTPNQLRAKRVPLSLVVLSNAELWQILTDHCFCCHRKKITGTPHSTIDSIFWSTLNTLQNIRTLCQLKSSNIFTPMHAYVQCSLFTPFFFFYSIFIPILFLLLLFTPVHTCICLHCTAWCCLQCQAKLRENLQRLELSCQQTDAVTSKVRLHVTYQHHVFPLFCRKGEVTMSSVAIVIIIWVFFTCLYIYWCTVLFLYVMLSVGKWMNIIVIK